MGFSSVAVIRLLPFYLLSLIIWKLVKKFCRSKKIFYTGIRNTPAPERVEITEYQKGASFARSAVIIIFQIYFFTVKLNASWYDKKNDTEKWRDMASNKVPQIRFTGYSDAWKECKLGEVGKAKSEI